MGERPALSWGELPAVLGRADLLGFAYLGTVRADGRPRIGAAALVDWNLATSEMTVTSWSPARGMRIVTRSYP